MNLLELIVFNVGHGLSVALIERPENYVTLVDLGASTGFTPLKYLRFRMKLQPDLLYITHPHADHLDDVQTAIDARYRPLGIYYQDYDWTEVKRREQQGLAYKIDMYQELLSLVPRREYAGKARLQAWRYTPAQAKRAFGEASYINNSSLFLIYTWGQFKIAIAGDLETNAMTGMLNTKGFVEAARGADILIPAHHGHKNGFPTDWVDKIGRPSVSIISVQERDLSLDPRYCSASFAQGVTFGGERRFALTTRSDGNIFGKMWYAADGKPTWRFDTTEVSASAAAGR